MNRQPMILAVLLLILALSAGYSFVMTPRQKTVQQPGQGERSRPTAAVGTAEGGETALLGLATALLDPPVEPYSGVRRNLFRSVAPPPPPPKVVVAPPAAAPPVVAPPPVAPPPVVAPAPAPAEPPARALARFTFLGYLQRGAARSIFLSSAGEIFVVHPGDHFGRRREFQVVSLSATQMVIRQGDDPRDIVVPLVEQAPLAAAPSGGGTKSSGSRLMSPRPAAEGAPVLPLPPEGGVEPSPEQDPTPTEGFTHGNQE